jgi:hypothetical protein
MSKGKVDKEKFDANFDSIDWGEQKEQTEEEKKKAKRTKRHLTTGMCGEFGTSEFDKEAFDENFDLIDWGKNENH